MLAFDYETHYVRLYPCCGAVGQMDSKVKNDVDWQTPIWDREKPRRFWDPSRKLLLSIRDYQKLKMKGDALSTLFMKLCVLRHRFWTVVTGAEIDLNCQIGGGLLMPHPNGIVIHPHAVIGANCLIFQQVTLAGKVELGYHVDVGAGAKILGPLKIGDNVRVGANSVVTKPVASNQTVVGIPAMPVVRCKKNAVNL